MSDVSNSINDLEAPDDMEQIPGFLGKAMRAEETVHGAYSIPLVAGLNQYRGQNTILKGGFLDNRKLFATKGQTKFRPFRKGALTPTNIARPGSQYVGGVNIRGKITNRGRKLSTPKAMHGQNKFGKLLGIGAGDASTTATATRLEYKSAMFKGFRRQNLTLNPFAFGRHASVSRFGPSGQGFYAAHQGGAFANLGNGLTGGKADPKFSGGIISRLGAINKIERRAARGLSTAGADMNIARITAMNNPMALVPKQDVLNAARLNMRGTLGGPGSTAAERLASARATLGTSEAMAARFESGGLNALGASLVGAEGATALSVGARRYAMTEGVTGSVSKSFMRGILTSGGGAEMRTSMGTAGMKSFGVGQIQMTETAEKIIRPLSGALEKNSSLMNKALSRGVNMQSHLASSLAPDIVAQRTGLMATEIVEKGLIKSLGTRGALHAAKSGGARVGLAVAGEAALAVIPGLNLIFAADMAYQLAKIGGKAIKAGINFGKDGIKSMQGSMNGGLFATYKDNEVAATSRARGVAAIQNSRLNARSLLGSEGAMMAAHFG